jgi:hypothetical protein
MCVFNLSALSSHLSSNISFFPILNFKIVQVQIPQDLPLPDHSRTNIDSADHEFIKYFTWG